MNAQWIKQQGHFALYELNSFHILFTLGIKGVREGEGRLTYLMGLHCVKKREGKKEKGIEITEKLFSNSPAHITIPIAKIYNLLLLLLFFFLPFIPQSKYHII
jgi:hypothetical protein